MNTARLSSETLHAGTVARDGRAVLICGPSGAGKSDVALQMLERGFILVSDDQTIVRREGSRLIAAAPATIAGKLEVRGLGIIEIEHYDNVPLALAVDLTSSIVRMPDDGLERLVLGIGLPLVSIDPRTASAAAKIALALDHLGLKP